MYVTKQDYFDYAGIDLEIELNKSNYDNPSKAAEIFITRIENWCIDYLKMFYETDDDVIAENSEQFKKGVLHQIDYLLRNGDVSIDGGNKIPTMARNALQCFKMGGLANIQTESPMFIIGGRY